MSNPVHYDLLGYLFDALEPSERSAVEESLRKSPSLRDELRRLRTRLDRAGLMRSQLDCGEFEFVDSEFDPPAGLADRTLQFIGERIAAQEQEAELFEQAAPLAEMEVGQSTDGNFVGTKDRPYAEPSGKRGWRGADSRDRRPTVLSSWRFIDLAMAIAVCICASALVLPMISASRSNAQILACANNQREIGFGLTQYSEQHNGYFPAVPETGSLAAAGIYAPTLLSTGYVKNPRLFVCPNSSVADDGSLRIPTLAQVQQASGEKLAQLRHEMGGSYGYALGYRQAGVYHPTRNLYRDTFALVADMPSDDHASSMNHNGRGHNVLLEDGHVVFLTSRYVNGSNDDIFTNDDGKIAAGCHINDAVVVQSDVSP